MSITRTKSDTRRRPVIRWTSTLSALVLGAVLGSSFVLVLRDVVAAPDIDLESVAETDPVAMSFVRDLNREPTPSAPIQRESIDRDELYEMINTIRWTTEEQHIVPLSESTTETKDDE